MENNNNNNTNNDWSKRDVGALWKREGSNQKYLSGYVKVDELGIEREMKVVVFSNKSKKNNEKAPDYRIYLSKPLVKQDEQSAQVDSKVKSVKSEKTKVKAEVQEDDSIL
jgi:uncharacterized protein (DUF736 family)